MRDYIINDKRWEWDVVEPGTKGDELTLDITSETVATYASDARYFPPRYLNAS